MSIYGKTYYNLGNRKMILAILRLKALHFATVSAQSSVYKKGSSSSNLSMLARADISCQFMKTRSLSRSVY